MVMNELIPAFTPEHAEILAGIPRARLAYWVRTGLIRPRFFEPGRWLSYKYLYSFRDLVAIRTLAELRGQRASLQTLRRVNQQLLEHYDEPWATMRFGMLGGKVVFYDPEADLMRDGERPAQALFKLDLVEIIDTLHDKVRIFRGRKPEDYGRVEQVKRVMGNQPVIAGTRITAEAVRNFHQAGYSPDAIRAQYPDLRQEDIQAAIDYAPADRRSA